MTHRCTLPNFNRRTRLYEDWPPIGTTYRCSRCRARWVVVAFTERGRAASLRVWRRLL